MQPSAHGIGHGVGFACARSASPLPPSPPALLAKWYLKFNSPNYLREEVSGKNGADSWSRFAVYTPGKFNDCLNSATANALLLFSGSDAAVFGKNYQADWTIDFYVKALVVEAGAATIVISQTGWSSGDRMRLDVQHNIAGIWNAKIQAWVSGVQTVNVTQALTKDPSAGFVQIRYSWNATDGKLRIANGDSVICSVVASASNFPNLAALGCLYLVYNPTFGSFLFDNFAFHEVDLIATDSTNTEPSAEYSST